MNNMPNTFKDRLDELEPEKRKGEELFDKEILPKIVNMEPEKKDVWEDRFRDELWQEDWTYETGMKYINFIKTHFIPRAEVVDYIKKNRHKIERIDRYVLDDLLDLLTQEK